MYAQLWGRVHVCTFPTSSSCSDSVKRWRSEVDVLEWQELAGDRLGWRNLLKSIKIRTQRVL
jgi:hypothetical protein